MEKKKKGEFLAQKARNKNRQKLFDAIKKLDSGEEDVWCTIGVDSTPFRVKLVPMDDSHYWPPDYDQPRLVIVRSSKQGLKIAEYSEKYKHLTDAKLYGGRLIGKTHPRYIEDPLAIVEEYYTREPLP